MKLVIVESPAKATTISKFLGSDYEVVASFGHIRDLPGRAAEVPKEIKSEPWGKLGVDIENDFTPYYVIPSESKKRVAELKKRAKDADEIVLATDEDREGESISWHLLEILKPKVPVKRIAFHEITREAIREAIAAPRDVNERVVRAQESRRILDRLYGYTLSPVLWKKVKSQLSAGRVQSVAVRLVVEREEARRAFHKAEYWDIDATLAAEGIEFTAGLVSLDGRKLATGKDFDGETGQLKNQKTLVLDEAESKRVAEALEGNLPWRITKVEQKKTKQRPYPPFITSTLQQSASAVLGYSPSRTMRIAQRLYEGIDFGGGEREGLITYMRTDSVTLSQRALSEAGQLIKSKFGDDYYNGPRPYATKSKMAQEAHEAIRPTHISRTPEEAAKYLPAEDLALYRLIWNRTVASQMADAELLKTVAEFEAAVDGKTGVLRANGSVVAFPGYLKVADTKQQDAVLPHLEEGEAVDKTGRVTLAGLSHVRHETKPPSRFTEASLVRRLEEEGIGRPSTYAPTISVIESRGYVDKRGNTLVPTFLGIAVVQMLRAHFQEYIDLGFTARMEDALDGIARGEQDWVDFLSAFYHGKGDFGPGLEQEIEKQLPNMPFANIPLGDDPETGEPIVVRLGRSAPFLQRGGGGAGNTAPVPVETTYDELTTEMAAEMIKARAERGDQALGEDPETGKKVYLLEGPYGPYVQLGEVEEQEGKKKPKKPKRASLLKDMKPEDVDLGLALKLLSLPRLLGEHPETGKNIYASNGRFGPFIRCGDDFRSLKAKEGDDPFTVTLDRALELLAQPKAQRGAKKVLRKLGEHPESKAEINLYDGRYGPYVSDGKVNASLAKDADPDKITLDEAVTLLANAPAKKKSRAKKKSATRKKSTAKKKTAAKKTAAKKKTPAKKKSS